MLEITASAISNIKNYLLQEKTDSAIRIAMISGGCAGPKLGITLDESKKHDRTFDQDGISFVVDESLLVACGAIKVDFINRKWGGDGFTVTSAKQVDSGSCGCSCSSDSCS